MAIRSIAVIRSPLVVKRHTTRRRPPGIQTAAGTRSSSTRLQPRAKREKAATRSAPSRLFGRTQFDRALVGAEDDVGVEDGEQRVEVAVSCGGEEGIDERRLAEPICLTGRGGLLYAGAGSACELTGRGGAALDDRGDLVERDREDVVQDEGNPLGRRERVEHDQEREPDRVG